MRAGSQDGSISIFLVISVGIVAIFMAMFARSYKQLGYARDYQSSSIAYYAAEGGAVQAIAVIERSGNTSGRNGRLGDGLYEVEITSKGRDYQIIARGYYHPKKVTSLKNAIAEARKGTGFHKNVIKISGWMNTGTFEIESFQRIPRFQ